MKHKYIILFLSVFIFCFLILSTDKKECFNNNNDNIDMIHGIPKVIYHIWINDNVLPKKFKENIKYIKNMNKDWKHIIYDDDMIINFIQTYY